MSKKGHLDQVLRLFGYLNKNKNQIVVVDYPDPILFWDGDALGKHYTETFLEFYPDAAGEIDTKIPEPNIDKLEVTIFVDSYHTHGKIT